MVKARTPSGGEGPPSLRVMMPRLREGRYPYRAQDPTVQPRPAPRPRQRRRGPRAVHGAGPKRNEAWQMVIRRHRERVAVETEARCREPFPGPRERRQTREYHATSAKWRDAGGESRGRPCGTRGALYRHFFPAGGAPCPPPCPGEVGRVGACVADGHRR
jgi:hypothetical protein